MDDRYSSKIARRITPSTTLKTTPLRFKRVVKKKGKMLNKKIAKAIPMISASTSTLGSSSSSSSRAASAEKKRPLIPKYRVSNSATIPLRKGSLKTLYLSDTDFISSTFVNISSLGCLTQITICFLERIITPSITACPPNASEGSSFPLTVNFILSKENLPILYSFVVFDCARHRFV